jgi:hypothetical protein
MRHRPRPRPVPAPGPGAKTGSFRNAKDTGLRNLPLHGFEQNPDSGARSWRCRANCWPGCRCSPSLDTPAAGNPSGSACGSSPWPAHCPRAAAAYGCAWLAVGPATQTSAAITRLDALTQLTCRNRPTAKKKPPGPMEARSPGATVGPQGTAGAGNRAVGQRLRPPRLDHERSRIASAADSYLRYCIKNANRRKLLPGSEPAVDHHEQHIGAN